MEIKQQIYCLVGGILSGVTIAVVTNNREQKVGEPSIIEKAKEWEEKVLKDGKEQAAHLEKVKQDIETATKKI